MAVCSHSQCRRRRRRWPFFVQQRATSHRHVSCKQQANPYRCDCAEPRASAPRMQCPSASQSRFPRRSSSFPGRKKLGWSGDAWIWQGPTLSSPEELANSLLPGRPASEGVQVLPGIGGWWLPGLPTRPPTVEECWLSLGYPVMVIRLYGYTVIHSQ